MVSLYMFTYRESLSSAEVQVQSLDFEMEGGGNHVHLDLHLSSFQLFS